MRVECLGATFDINERYLDAPPAEVRRQLQTYERDPTVEFDLSVRYPDSFNGRVMAAMAAIPVGETRTYGELAADLGTAPIAVGQACGRNPLPVVVPCHRVVGSDGDLRGYSSDGGVAVKRRLLEHEGVTVPVSADGSP